MDRAYFVNEFGGADKLVEAPLTITPPKAHEVLLKQTAVGVNFLDIYHRQGRHDIACPFIPGVEGIGIVEEIGSQVRDIQVGDRIAYTGYQGGYVTRRTIPAWRAIKIPKQFGDEIVSANLLRVYTAYMLLKHVYSVKPGDSILLHAATGGLGMVMAPYAKSMGAQVIGIVGRHEKVELAKSIGVDTVLVGRGKNFEDEIMTATNSKGVDYIVDGIGGSAFYNNFSYLKRFGLLANIGWIAGEIEQLEISMMQQGMFVRPSVMSFCSNPELYRKAIPAVLEIFANHVVKATPNVFSFDRLRDAHIALESGVTTGGIAITV